MRHVFQRVEILIRGRNLNRTAPGPGSNYWVQASTVNSTPAEWWTIGNTTPTFPSAGMYEVLVCAEDIASNKEDPVGSPNGNNRIQFNFTAPVPESRITRPDGTAYGADPRHVLRRNVQRATEKGYTFYIGPELEYYYLKSDHEPEVLDHATYFDQTTRDLSIDLRKDTVRALKRFGIQVEYSHHEVGPSQHEIDLRYCEALKMADNVMTYRLVVKEVAQLAGAPAARTR